MQNWSLKPTITSKAQFHSSVFSLVVSPYHHQANHTHHFTNSSHKSFISILRALSITSPLETSISTHLLSLSTWWMAKNNKYTSINFNHIYEKTINNTTSSNTAPKSTNPSSLSPSPSSFSASYSAVSAPNKPHGRILVLTRPTPKPVNPPLPSPSKQPPQPQPPNPIQTAPDQPRSEQGSDSISLRPLGRTGAGPVLSGPNFVAHEKDRAELPAPPLISPKPDKFVPPHLRPGYVPREEAPSPGPDAGRVRDAGHRRMGHMGLPGQYEEDGRPKSGGYERMRRGGGPDMGIIGRPRSSGSRPSSSG